MSIEALRGFNYIDSYRKADSTAKQSAKLSDSSATLPKAHGASGDSIVISNEERAKLKKEAIIKQQAEIKAQQEDMKAQMKAAEAEAKALSDAASIQSNCLLIASRIISGDEVPKEDMRYLAKNSPELYGKAMTLRISREHPKKYKRISPEDGEGAPTGTDASKGDSAASPSQDEIGAEPAPPTADSTGEAEKSPQ
ncbi:MAG: hypothetical protein RR315_00965 [Oscillospiraceae bacterium]